MNDSRTDTPTNNSKANILVVDDTVANLRHLVNLAQLICGGWGRV
jgi:hypothetical protein